jgi:hypothetical protein
VRTLVFVAVVSCLLLFAAIVLAEKVPEQEAVNSLVDHPALWVGADTKTSAHAMLRVHFWVGKEGEVEAIEQVCGERELFDEISDAVLEWTFKPRPASFVTDLSFMRQGRRIWLTLELPAEQRRYAPDCQP